MWRPGQIGVVTDIGVQAAKTGMLASSSLRPARDLASARAVRSAHVVDPVHAHPCTETAVGTVCLDSLRQMFPLATLLTPTLT